MKKMQFAMPVLLTVIALLFGMANIVGATPNNQVVVDGNLPNFTYLGQGIGTYTIEPDLMFLVKTYNEQGQFVFERVDPPTFEATRNSERVWSVDFLPEESIRYFDEERNFGTVEAGCQVNYVQIEDNEDERRNYFYLDGELIHTVEQGMVTYGSFVVPEEGELTFFANDSIGLIVDPCAAQVETPEATPTDTPEATLPPEEPTLTATPAEVQETPEVTPEVTPTPGEPTATPEQPTPTTTPQLIEETPVATPDLLPVTGGGPGPREVGWTAVGLMIAFVLLFGAWRRLWLWTRDE